MESTTPNTHLMAALGYSTDDLKENLNGVMSERQIKAIAEKRHEMLVNRGLIIVGVIGVTIVVIFNLPSGTNPLIQVILFALVAVMGLSPVPGLLKFVAMIQSDLRTRDVYVTEGQVYIGVQGIHMGRGAHHYRNLLVVGDKTLEIPRDVFAFLQQGDWCRVYHTEKSGQVLAITRLGDQNYRPEDWVEESIEVAPQQARWN